MDKGKTEVPSDDNTEKVPRGIRDEKSSKDIANKEISLKKT